MSTIWTPSYNPFVIRAYVEGPMVAVVMCLSPSRSINLGPPVMAAVAVGFLGSVILIIWTPPSSTFETAKAYVEGPMVVVVMPTTLLSSVKPFWPSVTAAVAVGFLGSVILIIWTPLSAFEATRAYVEGPMVVVVISRAPLSSVKPFWPSVTAAVAVGFLGSVILIIWTPSSRYAVTRAYVKGPMVAVVMARDPLSTVKPFWPSVTAAVAVGFLGSVILIIWTPLPE